MAAVHAWYYTDPACPWSWALEPAVRRLQWEFGDRLRWEYVMGGLAREFGPAERMVTDWLDAGDASGMPVDARLWLTAAPGSSYPACLAVKAAAEQGDPAPLLRRLREGFACGRRKLDSADALNDVAAGTPGLDAARFRNDLSSHAIVESFGADLDRCEAAGARAGAGGRVALPSLEFRGEAEEVHGVYSLRGHEDLRAAAIAAGARAGEEEAPGVEEALRAFGSLAAPEVAAVCGLPGPRAAAELWRLASEWRVRPERRGSGELWSLA